MEGNKLEVIDNSKNVLDLIMVILLKHLFIFLLKFYYWIGGLSKKCGSSKKS